LRRRQNESRGCKMSRKNDRNHNAAGLLEDLKKLAKLMM